MSTIVTSLLSKVKPHRTYQPAELYSKKYYHEKIQPLVKEKLDSLQPGSGPRLNLVRECMHEAFTSETPEVQKEILDELKAMKEEGKSTNVIDDKMPSPTDLQLYVFVIHKPCA